MHSAGEFLNLLVDGLHLARLHCLDSVEGEEEAKSAAEGDGTTKGFGGGGEDAMIAGAMRTSPAMHGAHTRPPSSALKRPASQGTAVALVLPSGQ